MRKASLFCHYPLDSLGVDFCTLSSSVVAEKSQLAQSGRASSTSGRHVSGGIANNLTPPEAGLEIDLRDAT